MPKALATAIVAAAAVAAIPYIDGDIHFEIKTENEIRFFFSSFRFVFMKLTMK